MEILSFSIVAITAMVVMWLSRQEAKWIQRVLDWFPAILFAYLIPAIITHSAGLDLSGGYIHTISKNWIISFAILTVMSALSISQLKIVGLKPIILFVAGSIVIATLPVILVFIYNTVNPEHKELFINNEYWKGLVTIVGGWIGGSTSQLVLKELSGADEGLFLSILVLDNILVNIWTILMFQFIKRSDQFNKLFRITAKIPHVEEDDFATTSDSRRSKIVSLGTILIIIVVANFVISSFLWKVISLSIVGLLLGNLINNWNHKFVLKMGGIAIIVIMAALGLKLNFANMSLPVSLVSLVMIWLVLHFIFMLIIAKLLRINIAWVPIASMANLGGISTAPAVTAAYKKELMPHAILLAILSMVSGTAWGMFTIWLFGFFT
ncbi:MAG: DUF819 family protein [Cyclobacteriaceae bacterium]